MFINHYKTKLNSTDMASVAFIKSLNVQAYPCGKRRARLDADTYIPFDPEARLNTEANTRKYSGLNGFTQTYISSWDSKNGEVSLTLAGYNFNIKLVKGYLTPSDFAAKFVDYTKEPDTESDTERIYANIRLKEVKLFSKEKLSYTTRVLKNQTSQDDSDAIDLYVSGDPADNNNYYFSGLSFSSKPLTDDRSEAFYYEPANTNTDTRSSITLFDKEDTTKVHQQVVSLCILEKGDNGWKIHQPALLPKVEHGADENSVKVNTLLASKLIQDGISVPALKLVESDGGFQLQFFNVDKP